ncbi:hypothetical protein C8R46DRAFT_1244399 [Mycena filopes]|nr:hypothetical protein C8R46DRAFT_1244399 [Mycena filopes]
MLAPLSFILLLSLRVMALRVNHTIDDTDPVVKYDVYKSSTVPIRCNANSCSSSNGTCCQADFNQLLEGTATSVAGQITVPFTGTSVWVFFAATHKIGCAFHLDGKDAGSFQHPATSPGGGNVLGYNNSALSNGPHELVIISEQGAPTDFDGLIYEYLLHLETSESNTTASGSPTSSSTSTPRPSGKRKGIIVGSVLGSSIFVLLVVSATVVFLRRRTREWQNLDVVQPFPLDEEKSTPQAQAVVAIESTAPVPQTGVIEPTVDEPASNLAGSLWRLSARFRQSVLSGWSGSGRTPPPAYSDGASTVRMRF